VRDEEAGAVILGSDQVVAFDGKILGKPGSKEAARDQLRALAGATHALVTAIALAHGGKIIEHVDLTKLTMRSLTSEQIARYVDADDPIDCAGSYKLEARGITLFTAIDSADHTAIVGLPLIAVTSMLGWLGFPVP
jgi:septum formation protein